MKIKFLGTSAGWPLPRLGCKCEICRSSDPKDTRTRSQALINDSLLLDAGFDTYYHLKNENPTTISACAISHEHPDHTYGLWDLSHIYNKKQKTKLIIHESTLRQIRGLLMPGDFEIINPNTEEPIQIENLQVSLLPVNHTKASFGILVTENTKSLFWAPDFKAFPAETIEKIKRVDILCMDGSELSVKTPGHQSIHEGIKLAKEINAINIYFIHIGHRTLPHKQLEKFVEKEGGNNFHIPYNSLEIDL